MKSIYDRFERPGQIIDQLGKAIFNSQMFGAENIYQGQILALECAAKRIPPMTLTERYYIIHGRLTMKSDAMLADLRAQGGWHRIVERNSERAAIEITLDGQTCLFSISWAEAQQEPFIYVGKESTVIQKLESGKADQLTLKNKYATPRSRSQMLWARVVSDGVRAMAPEVIAGHYTPEEISDVASPTSSTIENQHTSQSDSQEEAHTTTRRMFEGTPVPDTDTDKVDEATPAPTTVEHQPREATKPATDTPTPSAGGSVLLEAGTGPASETAYEQEPEDPCGPAIADEIFDLAAKTQLPDTKLNEVIHRSGANRLQDMPQDQANRLRQKLRGRLSDSEIPF